MPWLLYIKKSLSPPTNICIPVDIVMFSLHVRLSNLIAGKDQIWSNVCWAPLQNLDI